MIGLPVPAAIYAAVPDRSTCDNSMESGAPIVGRDGVTRYIESFAELVDRSGNSVGWVYLAKSRGAARAEYVQGNALMKKSDRTRLGVRQTTGTLTSVALLGGMLPADLRLQRCSVSRGR